MVIESMQRKAIAHKSGKETREFRAVNVEILIFHKQFNFFS